MINDIAIYAHVSHVIDILLSLVVRRSLGFILYTFCILQQKAKVTKINE